MPLGGMLVRCVFGVFGYLPLLFLGGKGSPLLWGTFVHSLTRVPSRWSLCLLDGTLVGLLDAFFARFLVGLLDAPAFVFTHNGISVLIPLGISVPIP